MPNIPTVFPLRLLAQQGDQFLPLPHLACLKEVTDFEDPKGHRVLVDFNPDTLEAAGIPHPYRDGHDWTAYIVTYDPARHYDQFTEATEFIIRRFRQGDFECKPACLGPSFSIFLSPIKNTYLEAMMSRGVGTLKDLTRVTRSRNIFRDALAFLAQLPEASPADLGTSLSRGLLRDLSLDFQPTDTPLAIADKLMTFKSTVANLDPLELMANRVQEAFPQAVANAIAALGLPLAQINLTLSLFSMLDDFARRHEFRFYNLQLTESNTDGISTLHIPPQDVPKIRLDENNEGEGGKDLRHVLCYHYHATPVEPHCLEILTSGSQRTLTLSSAPKGNDLQISVPGDRFRFGPSLALQNGTSFAHWVVLDADELKVDQLEGGQIEVSGFVQYWMNHPERQSLECTINCQAAFSGLKTGKITFLKS